MAEDLILVSGDKQKKYESLFTQLKALIGNEGDQTAVLANVAAGLKQGFEFFWVGFYLVKDGELVLGPFQGTVACMRIQYGKGVCGTAWKNKSAILVDDVDQFPGHIACSSFSKSEVVIPLIKNGEVLGVLDIDSDELAAFDALDLEQLQEFCTWLASRL